MTDPTPVLPKVGKKFHRGHGMLRHLYHVRAHVDDEYVVLRTWSARKGWRYEVVHVSAFDVLYEPVKRKTP